MHLFRQQIGSALIEVIRMSGTPRWTRRSGAAVLCYHNIVPDDLVVSGAEPFLHVPLSEFRQQIEWLRASVTVVPLTELLERLRQGRPVGGLAALTFDDGYTGVVRYALPIMQSAGFPFTVFPVVRAASEREPFWWDLVRLMSHTQREHNLTELQGDADRIAAGTTLDMSLPDDMLPASWDMLRTLLGADCTFGVHGMTHRSLTAIPEEQVVWELTRARYSIGEQLGVHADIVAYPYGRSNASVHEVANRTGFRGGMSTTFGLLRMSADVYDCARINVPAGLSSTSFSCWASGLRLSSG